VSETPETDAAQFGTGRVSVDFARRLERQRNETSHNLASIVAAILKRDGRDVFDMSATDRLAELHTAERQRDEARETAERYRLEANAMMMQRDRLAEALRKIDVARLDDFMGPHDMALTCVSIARETLAAVKGGNDES
jgi:hypothetical protein